MQHQDLRIEISIPEQRLILLQNEEILAEYLISTAEKGIGCEKGSYKTPTGDFEIAECIGGNADIGTIFKAREPIGVWPYNMPENAEDLILTRILWLRGLEEHNANTYDRYIYLHGTNQEELLGIPASHGCIRMSNSGIIELFRMISAGTCVKIVDYPLRR